VIDAIENGAAAEAGIKRGDVIVQVDANKVNKMAELLEQIGRKRPGDDAKIMVIRDGERRSFEVTLKNKQGTTQLFRKEELNTNRLLGAQFEELSESERRNYGLRSGVKVVDAGNGKLSKAGVPEGFIILKVNNQYVEQVEDLNDIVGKLSQGDGVLIQGYHPNGQADYFAFGL
jgi:S1-C subfamily serine protease